MSGYIAAREPKEQEEAWADQLRSLFAARGADDMASEAMRKPGTEDLTIKAGDVVEVLRDDGQTEVRSVVSDPWQLGHGTWVVGLDGISGGYALDRCKKLKFRPL